MARITGSSESETGILNAALVVFGRKGKDGARMQEIADEAGINKAMLHYYFRNKDSLYEAVFRHVQAHFLTILGRLASKNTSFKELLWQMIDAYCDEHAQHPEVFRLWTHENLNGADVAKRLLVESGASAGQGMPGLIMRRIQKAVDEGEIRPVDPAQLLMTLMGSIIFYFLASPVFSTFIPDITNRPEVALATRKQHIFDLLYYGLSK